MDKRSLDKRTDEAVKRANHRTMSRIFQIPAPIKSLFDNFPLKTYPPISSQDDAMHAEFLKRKYPFGGSSQTDINSTFALGVYNIFCEPKTKTILASDPWCLYAQFALCKKNALRLPCGNLEQEGGDDEYNHCLDLLSPFAANDETLPVLIEGYNKRYIRSTDGINEILTSRVNDDPEQLLFINMLDHIVYDCWMLQIFFHLSAAQFLKMYSFQDTCEIKDLKVSLTKRNHFHLRHREIVKNIESPMQCYQHSSIKNMLAPIQESCQTTLLQFQESLGNKPFVSTSDATPTYFELKIASYMLCIANLPDETPLKAFVNDKCQQLMHHAQLTLAKLHHITT